MRDIGNFPPNLDLIHHFSGSRNLVFHTNKSRGQIVIDASYTMRRWWQVVFSDNSSKRELVILGLCLMAKNYKSFLNPFDKQKARFYQVSSRNHKWLFARENINRGYKYYKRCVLCHEPPMKRFGGNWFMPTKHPFVVTISILGKNSQILLWMMKL